MQKNLLPLPFSNYTPVALKETPTEEGMALAKYIDESYNTLYKIIRELYWDKLPERVPSLLLMEWDILFNSNMLPLDSDYVKREKLSTSLKKNKSRGLWEEDIKKNLDLITGYNSSLYKNYVDTDSLMLSEPKYSPPIDEYPYKSTMGSPGFINSNLGMTMIGFGYEYMIKGVVSINCHEGVHSPVLTEEDIKNILLFFEQNKFAYFVISLGYIDPLNSFKIYEVIYD